MMRLLLTHGYFLAEDAKEQQIMKPYPPLGLLYLSSHLRSQGFTAEVYDSTFGSREELFGALDSRDKGVLGVYGNLLTRRNVLAITQRARESGWMVILGGPEPANYAEEFLNAGADLIVAGEGELSLERLARAEFARDAWARIPGLIYKDAGGGLIHTGPAELLQDLDRQPWPDRDQIEVSRYLQTWRTHHGKSSVSIITARGCPYRCTWCSHAVFGHTHRRRSPEKVVDEIEALIEAYDPDMLWIADDVFTIHHGWLASYAAEMKRRKIRIPFECITRADRVTPQIVDLMADLNCMRVWIGSESGSQKILDAMQRGVKVEQVQDAIALFKARGIQTGMFLMWGYEGEELSDIEATVQHVKRCRPDIFFTTVSYPIKGTPYFDQISPKLVQIGEWEASTDRDVRVKGRHSREFYRRADALLHAELADSPDPSAIQSARLALTQSRQEVEA